MKKPENISKFLCGGRNEEAIKAFYTPKAIVSIDPAKDDDKIVLTFGYVLRSPQTPAAQ